MLNDYTIKMPMSQEEYDAVCEYARQQGFVDKKSGAPELGRALRSLIGSLLVMSTD